MYELIMANKNRYVEAFPEFRRIFRANLRPFFDYTTGFDVIKFDEFLETPDGQSTRDVIRERYGDEGVKLIEKLIGKSA